MQGWIDPPTFGYSVSATQLNTLQSDLDYLLGVDQAPEVGCDSGRYPVHVPVGNIGRVDNPLVVWRGWTVNVFDRFVLKVSGVDNGTGNGKVSVHYGVDGSLTEIGGGLSPGTHTVYTDLAANEWQWNYPYCLEIRKDLWEQNITVDYVYGTGEVAAAAGIPTFENETAYAPNDLNNGLANNMRTLRKNLLVPAIGVRTYRPSDGYYQGPSSTTAYVIRQQWWLQHRHSRIRVAGHMRPPDDGAFSVELKGYNGEDFGTLEGWTLNAGDDELSINGTYDISDAVTAMGLNVGDWYRVDLIVQLEGSDGEPSGDENHGFYLRWWWEEPSGVPDGWSEMTRWSHGDYLDGDGGGTPELITMADNVTYLDGTARIVVPVQREPMYGESLAGPQIVRWPWIWRIMHRRRWRWLVYRGGWTDDSDEDNPKDVTPRLWYNTSGNADWWGSIDLPTPADDNWLDLDTTPVRPGMMFYVDGAKYAIQHAEPY